MSTPESAFIEWAAAQAGAPRDTGALFEGVEESQDFAGLLLTDVQGRRVVWKSVAASAKARVTVPAVSIEALDPWIVEPAPLREGSDHIAVCDGCAGERKTRCAECSGAGKVVCTACGGQRKAYGYSANGAYRLLNCTACRGKGEADCAHCRRGTATCATCAGEGRLQRWVELEMWSRSVTSMYPEALTRPFQWSPNPSNQVIAQDAEVVMDVERPHRLTAADVGSAPAQWLAHLAPRLEPGERVARQRLRIARIPAYTIRYRVGSDEDRVTFTGRRLLAAPHDSDGAFARRASNLRSLRWLLLAMGIAAAIVSLGRGTFYWSVATLLSVMALGAALAALYGAALEWTATRRRTGPWLIAALSFLIVAAGLELVARPRLTHAERLIAAGRIDDAEKELNALAGDAVERARNDLRLARVRRATDILAAREILAQIPRGLPQYASAAAAIDELILQTATARAANNEWSAGTEALALLSARARGTRDARGIATAVYLPLVRKTIADRNWAAAADAIVSARRVGVAAADLEPHAALIRDANLALAAQTKRESDASRHLRLRLSGEAALVTWEQTMHSYGTPPLIALRTAMARDIALLEKPDA